MRYSDSLDKVIEVYLGALCRSKFTYKGKVFSPMRVVVSPLLLRGYTCPMKCGACCGSFSLDYLPSEKASREIADRFVDLSGQQYRVLTDFQSDVPDRWCRHLDRAAGRCKIYCNRPFTCDFELIRVLIYSDKAILTQKQYGRAWAMTRLDGGKGALCQMLPPDPQKVAEVDRKLDRLAQWASHFGVPTCIAAIRTWVQTGDHRQALILPVSTSATR